MLETFVIPKLSHEHFSVSRLWFQQDGATPHTTQTVLSYLGEVSRKGGFQRRRCPMATTVT